MSKNKFEVQWEDDDSFEEVEHDSGSDEFAQMLAQDQDDDDLAPAMGDELEGTVLQASGTSSDILLELSRKLTATMSAEELTDENGKLTVAVGDKVTGYVISLDDGDIVLSRSMSHKMASEQALDNAFQGKVPVDGRVVGENKGGFEVEVFGKKAFCPVSEMDLVFVRDKKPYIGNTYQFIIKQMERRNMVVSRAELLRQAEAKAIEKMKEQAGSAEVFDGVVKEVRDFGLFVEARGVTGLVHVSQLSYGRGDELLSTFSAGDKVRVKVLEVDDSGPKTKVSMSIKAAEEDPWLTIGERFQVGESYEGRIVRTESFGAFVELASGIEGLIHISEMSWLERVRHPKDVVQVGQTIEVRILSIDSENKRIGLSMKSLGEDPWAGIDERFPNGKGTAGTVQSLRGFGAIVQLAPAVTGLIPVSALTRQFGQTYKKKAMPGKELEVVVLEKDLEAKKILLGFPDQENEEAVEDLKEYVSQSKTPSTGSFGDLLSQSIKNRK